MKEFPEILNVNNKDKFEDIYNNRMTSYLRQKIYEHVIKNDQNNYFDLDNFRGSYKIKNIEDIKKMTNTIIEELCLLGWKCKLSYGGTALFIYSSDKPPSSCWDDEL
jgi:hypothetical protein